MPCFIIYYRKILLLNVLRNLYLFEFCNGPSKGFNICFNIHSILLNAVERLLNDVERWDGQTVSTFHSTKLSEWPGN